MKLCPVSASDKVKLLHGLTVSLHKRAFSQSRQPQLQQNSKAGAYNMK
jgi:hypothetical protein